MNPNLQEAKKFAIETFNGGLKGTDLVWMIKHCEGVFECCNILSQGKEVNLDTLEIASWLHDIGRVATDEGHAKKSLELSEKRFGKLDEKLKDCILNHSSSLKPKTNEGRLFQIADKMSLLSLELFIIYAKEDKKGAIDFFKKGIESFFEMYKKLDGI